MRNWSIWFFQYNGFMHFFFRTAALFTYSHHYHDVTTLASRSILPIEVVVLFVESKLKIAKTSSHLHFLTFPLLSSNFTFFIFYFWPFYILDEWHLKNLNRLRIPFVIVLMYDEKMVFNSKRKMLLNFISDNGSLWQPNFLWY